MDWIEVCVNTPGELIDSRCGELTVMGADGFVIENEDDFKSFLETNRQYWDYVDEELENSFKGISRIKCYLEDSASGKEILKKITDAYGSDVSVSSVKDSDWENNWKEYYKPIEVGEKLVIVPQWLDTPDDGRLSLRLDPGLIFGTGSHATTRMCLSALECYAADGKKVLDLGCGSGILGIGALILGCSSCKGCDIDPKAPDVASGNALLNEIGSDRFSVYSGDILKDEGMRCFLDDKYDIVLANIVSDVIIPLSGIVGRFLAPDGVFITSGIIDGRQDEVEAAIKAAGFKTINHRCEEEWHCFECVVNEQKE